MILAADSISNASLYERLTCIILRCTSILTTFALLPALSFNALLVRLVQRNAAARQSQPTPPVRIPRPKSQTPTSIRSQRNNRRRPPNRRCRRCCRAPSRSRRSVHHNARYTTPRSQRPGHSSLFAPIALLNQLARNHPEHLLDALAVFRADFMTAIPPDILAPEPTTALAVGTLQQQRTTRRAMHPRRRRRSRPASPPSPGNSARP